MGKSFPTAYEPEKRNAAIAALEKSAKSGLPNFNAVSKETGISWITLQRWWLKHQLERQQELKIQFECAITKILGRIEKLAEETNNLKELAPVVKMLSELLQQFGENEALAEEWG